MDSKLDKKSIGAGVLLLLNAILWFVQVCWAYVIQDGGFWGVGGMIQNLLTNELTDLSTILFLVAVIVAAITLFTRKRVAAVIGLLILAGYYIYALIPNISDEVIKLIVPACRILGILFAAIAIGQAADSGVGKVLRALVVIFMLGWLLVGIVLNIVDNAFASMALPVVAILIARNVMLALGVILAALSATEKKAGAHWA